MIIALWIIVGLITGLTVNWLMIDGETGDIKIAVILSVIGGVGGGLLAYYFGFGDLNTFDIRSLFLIIGGAMALLFGFRSLNIEVMNKSSR